MDGVSVAFFLHDVRPIGYRWPNFNPEDKGAVGTHHLSDHLVLMRPRETGFLRQKLAFFKESCSLSC